jgi:hypothetical protein
MPSFFRFLEYSYSFLEEDLHLNFRMEEKPLKALICFITESYLNTSTHHYTLIERWRNRVEGQDNAFTWECSLGTKSIRNFMLFSLIVFLGFILGV